MLVSDVLRRVQRSIGDSDQIFITNADLIDWVNDGQVEICRQTDCLTGTQSFVASDLAGGVGKNFPADRIKTKRVTYTDVTGFEKPLKLIAVSDLDNMLIPSDAVGGGEPSLYYFEGEALFVWPRPASSDANTVRHTYSKVTTTVTAIGDTIGLPIAYQGDLVQFCTARAHGRDQNYRAQQMAQAEFDTNLAARKNESQSGDDSFYAVQEWSPYS